MDAQQVIADAAEDVAIRRYLSLSPARGSALLARRLTCGSCGAPQMVHVQQGMRLAAFVCRSCHGHTRAWV